MYARAGGGPTSAFPHLGNLMDESSADAPWLEPIRLQIQEVAFRRRGSTCRLAELAGNRVAPRGPTAGDIRGRRRAMASERQAAMIEEAWSQGLPEAAWRPRAAHRGLGAGAASGRRSMLGRTEDAPAVYDEARTVICRSARGPLADDWCWPAAPLAGAERRVNLSRPIEDLCREPTPRRARRLNGRLELGTKTIGPSRVSDRPAFGGDAARDGEEGEIHPPMPRGWPRSRRNARSAA